jgi:16S rRNA (cytidine1402-2'-O)-methyltransferase
VATPIGNLEDMTARAVRVLKKVDLIAAEDTRHSATLLRHFGIHTETISLHEHNERDRVPSCVELLRSGKSIALISDAGTPLISDPGYRLVGAAVAAGASVVPVPGVCAAIAALSVAGLPTDRFGFEGFPPTRTAGRRASFEGLASEVRTLIFYESAHRIAETIDDMIAVFGADRPAVIARELTKTFETIYRGTLAELGSALARSAEDRLGEFVVVVRGASIDTDAIPPQTERVLRLLLAQLPLKQAVSLAAEIAGASKNLLYRRALDLKGELDGDDPH